MHWACTSALLAPQATEPSVRTAIVLFVLVTVTGLVLLAAVAIVLRRFRRPARHDNESGASTGPDAWSEAGRRAQPPSGR